MPDLYEPENRRRPPRFVTQSRLPNALDTVPNPTGATPWLPGLGPLLAAVRQSRESIFYTLKRESVQGTEVLPPRSRGLALGREPDLTHSLYRAPIATPLLALTVSVWLKPRPRPPQLQACRAHPPTQRRGRPTRFRSLTPLRRRQQNPGDHARRRLARANWLVLRRCRAGGHQTTLAPDVRRHTSPRRRAAR
jgi:hypothetical protein